MAEVLYDSLFVIVKHELFSFPKWETSRLVVEEKRIVMKMDSQESSNDVSELQAIDSICPCARRWLGHELPLITCKCWRVKMNPWVYWLLLNELRRSTNFRINVIRNILRSRSISWYRLKLVCPHSGAIHLPVRIIVRTTSDNCIAIDRLW